MKHLLTTLLVLLTFTLHSQVEETYLIGKDVDAVVNMKGDPHDYGTDESLFLQYDKEDYTELYYFSEYGTCYEIYIVMEGHYKNAVKRYLSQDYAYLEGNTWFSTEDRVYLHYYFQDGAVIVKITKHR